MHKKTNNYKTSENYTLHAKINLRMLLVLLLLLLLRLLLLLLHLRLLLQEIMIKISPCNISKQAVNHAPSPATATHSEAAPAYNSAGNNVPGHSSHEEAETARALIPAFEAVSRVVAVS